MNDSPFDYGSIEVTLTLMTGSLVRLIEPMAGKLAGTWGVVYHYEVENGTGYSSVLLANSHDIGTFAPVEAETSLSCTGQQALDCVSINPVQLKADCTAGVFAACFDRN